MDFAIGQKGEMMDDTISRQAALDAVAKLYAIHGSEGSWFDQKDALKALSALPSADFTKKIPYYRAKHFRSGKSCEGFYFAYPQTTYCRIDDYERHPVEIIHCICSHHMMDWGLPNDVGFQRIDPDTLELIGWFTVRESYGTESWVERS